MARIARVVANGLPHHVTQRGTNRQPGNPPSYDANGSLLADAFHTYTWDANGHNISIDNNAAIMAYDALGRWVERANSAGHTQAVYAPDGSLLAVANGQALVHGYLAMPGGAMAHYTSSGLAEYWHRAHRAFGARCARLIMDWLGTPRLASTPTRTVSNDMSYAPYGEQYGGSYWRCTGAGIHRSAELPGA